ncbi:MAG: rhodanese-like domain-containing protein [Desulfamplus sp.]|nr:rhodanese-like domain-containing protein [Desulfamplus sp.]
MSNPIKLSNPFKQALWQIPAITLMACLMALTINQLRSDRIPVVGDWSVDARFSDSAGDSLVISLQQAGALFDQKAVLFLDARPVSIYEEGHIQGAISLPWQDIDSHFMEIANQLEGQKNIVTYCDGESCELSHELALFLKEMGFDNVHVLVNGWSAWLAAGLPTRTSNVKGTEEGNGSNGNG